MIYLPSPIVLEYRPAYKVEERTFGTPCNLPWFYWYQTLHAELRKSNVENFDKKQSRSKVRLLSHQSLYRSKKISREHNRLPSPPLDVCARNDSCGEERGKTALFAGYKENQVRHIVAVIFKWIHASLDFVETVKRTCSLCKDVRSPSFFFFSEGRRCLYTS